MLFLSNLCPIKNGTNWGYHLSVFSVWVWFVIFWNQVQLVLFQPKTETEPTDSLSIEWNNNYLLNFLNGFFGSFKLLSFSNLFGNHEIEWKHFYCEPPVLQNLSWSTNMVDAAFSMTWMNDEIISMFFCLITSNTSDLIITALLMYLFKLWKLFW